MRVSFKAWLLVLVAGVLAATATQTVRADDPKGLIVFGASSLTNVLDELDQAYTAKTKVPVKGSYAASSALAKQIEQGAPADLFFSADTDWVDYLDKKMLLKAGTRKDVVTNRLVLIAPVDSKIKVKIGPHFDLAGAIGDSKLATGDPDSVPVGKYAAAALTKLGVWDAVAPKVARAENVRAALAFVARGEAVLGIVYETDAKAEPKVRVVDVFPADTHPPITYPVALTVNAQPGAEKFEAFITGSDAKKIFRKYGFTPLH